VIQASYFLNKSYIAKELCINRDKPKSDCNGKCYLAKKLKEEERQEQKSSAPKREKIEVQLFYDVQCFNLAIFRSYSKVEYFKPAERKLPAFSLPVFHPPTA
jgi:hypothetical protein